MANKKKVEQVEENVIPAPIIIPEVKTAEQAAEPALETSEDKKGVVRDFFVKLTSRKLLVALFLPILKTTADRVGLGDYVSANANDIIDIIVWAAPMVWMVIEGFLDKERIKQQGSTTVQAIKSNPSAQN